MLLSQINSTVYVQVCRILSEVSPAESSMRSCVPILTTLALSACYVYASPLVCLIFCSQGHDFPAMKKLDHCDCANVDRWTDERGQIIRFKGWYLGWNSLFLKGNLAFDVFVCIAK